MTSINEFNLVKSPLYIIFVARIQTMTTNKDREHIWRKAIEEYRERHGIVPSPKAFLFDMDGVLFDSMKNHTLAWYKTMSGLGIPCERNEFYLYEGCTGKGTINNFFRRTYSHDATDEEVQQIYSIKSNHFNQMPKAEPMPGAKEVLEKVNGRGLKIVLVTGSGQRSLLERLNLAYPGIFTPQNMVTAFDVTNGKPDPEPYIRGLEKAAESKEHAIVIENAPMGCKSGRAAGIFTIAVNTGPIPADTLLESGADIVLNDMVDLSENIETILKLMEQ